MEPSSDTISKTDIMELGGIESYTRNAKVVHGLFLYKKYEAQ